MICFHVSSTCFSRTPGRFVGPNLHQVGTSSSHSWFVGDGSVTRARTCSACEVEQVQGQSLASKPTPNPVSSSEAVP